MVSSTKRRERFSCCAVAFCFARLWLRFLCCPHTGRADALDQIKSRGTMVVAIDPTFPPFEYTDSAGKVIGYDPELIELIAADMGVEVEYQVMASAESFRV